MKVYTHRVSGLSALVLFCLYGSAMADVSKVACNGAEFIIQNKSASITVTIEAASNSLQGISAGMTLAPNQQDIVATISEQSPIPLLGKSIRPEATINFSGSGTTSQDFSVLKGKYKNMGDYCETSAEIENYIFETFNVEKRATKNTRGENSKITFSIIDKQ